MGEHYEQRDYLPPTLRHKIERISGFRKQSTQVPSQTTGTFAPNSQIRIWLPPRAIIDLGSLVMRFQLTLTPPSAGTTPSVSAPRFAQSFFRKVELLIGGKSLVLSSLNAYGDAFNAIGNVVIDPIKQKELSIYELGGDVVAGTGAVQGFGLNGVYTTATTLNVSVSNWLGALSGSLTKYLPTQIMGSQGVELRITLNDASILPVIGTPGTATYSITNVFLTSDIISFQNDLYGKALADVWEAGLPVRLPFKDFYDFSSSTSTGGINSTFSVSSESIDSIWTVMRATTYDTQAVINTASKTSNYFTFISGSDPGPTGSSNGNVGTYVYTINSLQYPQYQADASDVYNSLLKVSALNSGSHPHYTNGITDASQWVNAKFVVPLSLEMNQRDNRDIVSSGLSTSGANLPIVFKASGLNTSLPSGFITSHFVETTSELQVFPGELVNLKQ